VSVIATLIEPHRVTRVFFDCRDAIPDPTDRRLIELTIERSNALTEALAFGGVTGSFIASAPEHVAVPSAVAAPQ
jgi:hypothetical protein